MEARESRKSRGGGPGESAGSPDARRQEELDLYEKWKSGDEAAFEVLYHRYQRHISRFFKNRTSSPADVDLTQETFAICMRQKDKFEFRSTFRTYIFAIARNLLLAHRAARQFEPLENVASHIAKDLTSPSSRIDKHRKLVRLHQLVSELPEDKQDLLQCRFRFEFSMKEIGEHFDIEEVAVRQRLFRIIEDLRAAFSDQERRALAAEYPRNKLIAKLAAPADPADASGPHVTKPKVPAPPRH